jgi:hypothetical protein
MPKIPTQVSAIFVLNPLLHRAIDKTSDHLKAAWRTKRNRQTSFHAHRLQSIQGERLSLWF